MNNQNALNNFICEFLNMKDKIISVFSKGEIVGFVSHSVSDFPFWKNMMGRADEHMALSKRASL
jgi:hypothetical protein